jgi:hypothetical protein
MVKDLEDRQNVPQSERMFPNMLEQGRRVIDSAIQKRRRAKNPPPIVEGAKVVGFKKPNTTA